MTCNFCIEYTAYSACQYAYTEIMQGHACSQ